MCHTGHFLIDEPVSGRNKLLTPESLLVLMRYGNCYGNRYGPELAELEFDATKGAAVHTLAPPVDPLQKRFS